MTSEQASRVVFVSGAGMATFVLIQAARDKRPQERTYKSLWAIGLLTIGLSVFADFAPQVAGPFALLALVAMATRNTGALGSVIGGGPAVRGSASTASRPPATAAPRKGSPAAGRGPVTRPTGGTK